MLKPSSSTRMGASMYASSRYPARVSRAMCCKVCPYVEPDACRVLHHAHRPFMRITTTYGMLLIMLQYNSRLHLPCWAKNGLSLEHPTTIYEPAQLPTTGCWLFPCTYKLMHYDERYVAAIRVCCPMQIAADASMTYITGKIITTKRFNLHAQGERHIIMVLPNSSTALPMLNQDVPFRLRTHGWLPLKQWQNSSV
eukprot:546298-Pelagomonas_calceolata.AAC.1